MGKPKQGAKKSGTNNGPRIIWRNGRAYADLRAYAGEGGRREALAEPGGTWGTTDPDIALALFQARLAELDAKKRQQVGAPTRRSITLAELVRDHLLMKAKAGRTSDGHLEDLEQRLTVALDYFGRGRDPRTLDPSDVRAWGEQLATSGRRKPGTVRH